MRVGSGTSTYYLIGHAREVNNLESNEDTTGTREAKHKADNRKLVGSR